MGDPSLAESLALLLSGRGIPAPLWSALRALLRVHLRRRGLWSAPPAYFGCDDFASWSDEGALDALVTDFYADHLRPRLRLDWATRSEERISGLFHLMFRQFLTERQRRHDPIGFALHENVVQALSLAAERGTLRGADGAPRRSETFSPAAAPEAPRIAPEALAERVQCVDGWAELVPLLACASTAAQALLADCIAETAARPPPVTVTARDVVAAVRDEVRAATQVALSDPDQPVAAQIDDEGARELVRVVFPDEAAFTASERRHRVERLRAAVAQLACQERVRAALFRVLDALLEDEDDPPTRAELGRRLGIPKSRLHELLERLRRLGAEDGGVDRPEESIS